MLQEQVYAQRIQVLFPRRDACVHGRAFLCFKAWLYAFVCICSNRYVSLLIGCRGS